MPSRLMLTKLLVHTKKNRNKVLIEHAVTHLLLLRLGEKGICPLKSNPNITPHHDPQAACAALPARKQHKTNVR
jgi:hypothetical protein